MDDPFYMLSAGEKLLLSLCRLDFSEEQKLSIRDTLMEVKDWDHFIKLTNEHGVIALSWHNITNTGNSSFIPPEYLKLLHNTYLRNLARNTYLYDQLARILELIKDDVIRVVLLKGMALEKTIYGNLGLRQMTDIDLLVDQNVILKFRRILIKNGFKSEPFKSPLYKYLTPYLNRHVPRLTKSDCHVEIHSRLFDQIGNSLSEKILESSTPLNIGEYTAFIPPAQLFFLYLISHLEHHIAGGDYQLRQYTDLYLLLSAGFDEIINKQLFDYASEISLDKQLAANLYILQSFWQIDYPDWLNKYLSREDYKPEITEFLRFLKHPGDSPANRRSSKYLRQIEIIPGLHRKLLYIAGFVFPSPGFMKKRYKTKTLIGTIVYYPARWVRSAWMAMRGVRSSGRRAGKRGGEREKGRKGEMTNRDD